MNSCLQFTLGGVVSLGWTAKRRAGLKHLSLFMSIVDLEDGRFYPGFYYMLTVTTRSDKLSPVVGTTSSSLFLLR